MSTLRRLRRLRGRPAPAVPLDRSERALRRRITKRGGSLSPSSRPGDAWRGRRNRALRDRTEVDAAIAEVRALGLVPHPDDPKNWDLTVALGTILDRTTPDARILEMGAATYSPLLVWLYQYGYRRLHGIDLVYAEPGHRGPILFEPMDLTRTTFEDASFDAIACLSVIEHGVDPAAYLREVRRLLRPGGVLVTSTDYWVTPVDTAGATAYGAPVRILDESAIRGMLEEADRQGFRLDGPAVDYGCGDRVVCWAPTGLEFTFLVVNLEAPAG